MSRPKTEAINRLTHTTQMKNETATTFSIADGDYNRDVEVVAMESGLRVDESFTISWEWIASALVDVGVRLPADPADTQTDT